MSVAQSLCISHCSVLSSPPVYKICITAFFLLFESDLTWDALNKRRSSDTQREDIATEMGLMCSNGTIIVMSAL